ncbi:MAG: APC family permease [Alphaproteobacteria bacterium]|nr:APC family permease [Alphaproteobacteria bacterium]MCB9695226.1 APC family permease [Alphaproteobacteria bacterium]
MRERDHFLGLASGVGLVIANMVGAGVFLSAGFMAQQMDARTILWAWVLGAFLALCGAVAYGGLVDRVPRSGGEYRFLSDLLHPAVGFLAGWASLLVGFAAPVAVDGMAVGAFLSTIAPWAPRPELTGSLLIAALTALHGLRLDLSKWGQNGLVAIKILGVLAFVALGLGLGRLALPDWVPPHPPDSPARAFLESQFWIAFAFSGWNAAIYLATEFREPKRDVPRAMVVGTLLVSVLYLLVNGVLLANLAPDQLATVLSSDTHRVTLGHVVAESLLGPVGGWWMSAFAVLALTSAMSAMMMVGPRVYAEMADDGFLPRWLSGRPAPTGSVVLQGGLAILLLNTQTMLEMVQGISSVLMVFTGLCTLSVLRLSLDPDPPSWPVRVAAGIYTLAVGWILYIGLTSSSSLWVWGLVVGVLGVTGWALSRRAVVASASSEPGDG